MREMTKGLKLIGVLIAVLLLSTPLMAQLSTTTIDDTVYRADGTPAGGSVVISWGAFTTQAGAAVAAGTKTVTIGSDGTLEVALAPNSGGVPMGTYYTAVFHLNDGTTKKEFWSVPAVMAGSSPTKLAAISTTVLPASVAMQTVSKQYVDNAIAAAQAGIPLDASPYVLKAGDTMTGPLTLPGDPVSAHAGIESHAKLGDWVEAGQAVFALFAEDEALIEEPYRMMEATVKIADEKPVRPALVREVVTR